MQFIINNLTYSAGSAMAAIQINRCFHVLEHLSIAVNHRYLTILLLFSAFLLFFFFSHHFIELLLTPRIDIRMLLLNH